MKKMFFILLALIIPFSCFSQDRMVTSKMVGKTALYGNSNGTPVPFGVDSASNGQVSIFAAHSKIHEGKHFYLKDYIDVTGSGTTVEFLLVTADSDEIPHLLVSFTTEAEFTFEAYAGTTTSADGTPISVFNNNFNSSNTSVLSAYASPTITADGDRIWGLRMGSGGGRSTGNVREDAEYVLEPDTKYLLRITKNAIGTDWVDYHLYWYDAEEE